MSKLRPRGERKARRSTKSLSKKLTILLTEDNTSLCDVISVYLRRQGYRVHTASSGKAVLDLLAAEEIHLLVLDLMLPEGGGFEVLRQVCEGRRGGFPYVIVMSDLGREEDRRKVRELGGDEYLIKPFQLSYLLEQIVTLENRHRHGEGPERSS